MKGRPLITILDKTVTPMGSRMMKKWLVLPLKEKNLIEERLNVVDFFFQNVTLIEEILGSLKLIGDLERLISKVVVGRANPRELNQIKKALLVTKPIKELLKTQKNPTLKSSLINCTSVNFYWRKSKKN